MNDTKKNMLESGKHQRGILLGVLAIVVLTGVSLTLLFKLGSSDESLQSRYLAAKYKTSSPAELERKIEAIGNNKATGFAQLKNLDMPDYRKVEATLKNVDLFDHVFTKQELCLTQAVYFEGRGEPLIGQVAIAEVVLNRVVNRKYPDSVCGVVFQNQHLPNRCQFSFACDGKVDRPTDLRAWEKSLKVVALVIAGERSGVAKRATHYHASYVSPNWRHSLNKVGEVGRHIFYKDGVI